MKAWLFHAARVWRSLSAPLRKTMRIFRPPRAQARGVEVALFKSPEVLRAPAGLPTGAIEEAQRVRREFESGRQFAALARRAHLGDYTLEVEEQYCGARTRHTVSVTSRKKD